MTTEEIALQVSKEWQMSFAGVELDFALEVAKRAVEAEHEACNRKLLLDLWDALHGHEATGDTAGSLRAMLMLSEVGDEIKARSNAIVSGLPQKKG